MDTPTIAALIHENLELTEGKSCKSSGAKWVEVVGWKGYRDVDEIRTLDGNVLGVVADEDASKAMFNAAGLSLPDDITPLIVLRAVNLWVFTTYRRRWEIMANEFIQPPLYSPGFCRTSRCPNAAFAYVLCNACCRSRYGLEVKQTTGQGKVGLGLFACGQFSPDAFVVPLSWYVKLGHECHRPSPFLQH